jgi:hypothetical protein
MSGLLELAAGRTPCSALRGDRCYNGFWVTAACYGIGAEHVAPTCCNEDRCAHLYGHWGGVPPVIAAFHPFDKDTR